MKYLLTLLVAGWITSVSAQTFSSLESRKGNLYDDRTFNLYLRYTDFSDPYTESVNGLTANVSWRRGGSGKGQANWHFENPTLGDFIFVLAHFKKWKESTVNKSFGAGFFGWHQIYINALVKNRLIIAPGFSMGDYIFGIQQPESDPATLEPNGYYFHLGPAIKVSYVITSKMWVEGWIHNDIGFRASKPSGAYQKIEGYEKPYFLNVGASLFHTSRLFGGFRVNKLIDRGVNNIKATRIDVSAGYMF